ILNVAMGGTLGGLVDPNFTSDQMVVDYVRVYQ
ncbi:MAG: laminarinase, partial [Flavobacteriaceae bacterium]|nr:laminarinase [Flavobacteriaceae bacterium]